MKKIYLIVGMLVLAGAIALVIYINMKPSRPKGPQGAPPEETVVEPEAPSMRPQHPTTTPQMNPKSPAPPQHGQNAAQKINAFVSHAGIEKDFQNAADILKDLLQHLSPGQQKMMQALLDKISGPEFLDEYKKTLEQNFSDSELDHLSSIYNDKDVEAFHESARQASTQEGQTELLKHLNKFDPEQLPSDRREALTALADAQMKSIEGIDTQNLSDEEKRQYQAFHESMRVGVMAQLDLMLKGKPVDRLQHLGSKLSDSIYIRERQARAKMVSEQYEQAAEVMEVEDMN